ncbi:MAG: hypothetical protein RR513_05805 [Muribaculaceae bacterium]
MKKIDIEISGYRIVSDDGRSGQVYAHSGEAEIKWLLVGQWHMLNERVVVIYDAPQEVDCAQLVREALAENEA